ncbi:MAG: high-affinity branched-chain amino acid ABC transporter ATP-binding protein LivG, partial [Candidatus Rokuibacteriota bacterium]
LLERAGLAGEAHRRRDEISAAALARLELAQALALAPRLLLLDSPLGRLPLEDRPGIAALIGEIRASGATVLLTEREAAVADAVADRVAVLDRGVVVR